MAKNNKDSKRLLFKEEDSHEDDEIADEDQKKLDLKKDIDEGDSGEDKDFSVAKNMLSSLPLKLASEKRPKNLEKTLSGFEKEELDSDKEDEEDKENEFGLALEKNYSEEVLREEDSFDKDGKLGDFYEAGTKMDDLYSNNKAVDHYETPVRMSMDSRNFYDPREESRERLGEIGSASEKSRLEIGSLGISRKRVVDPMMEKRDDSINKYN